jgi:LmbE family N-acetylglucosaminyl deacetylase
MQGINSILVVVAHPDDEVFGCGGTIARLTKEMKDVYVAILGEGITSRFNKRELADKSELKTLQNSSKRVAELLGVKELFLYDLPDNRFDTIPLLDIVKIIEALIDKVKPSTIFTHHGGDLNIDHSIVHRATLTATRPIAGQSVKRVYAYEVPSSTEWAFGQFTKGFQANVFVDISVSLEKKIEAMEIYESEARSFPHPRSPEALRALAKRWGATAGLEAAEAFELIREIR